MKQSYENRSSYAQRIRTLSAALAVVVLSCGMLPGAAHAAEDELEISGWIPWWQEDEGIDSARDHLSELGTVYPFVFEVDTNGILIEKSDLDDRKWKRLFRDAERRDVEVIPTVAWFNGAAIHAVLSDEDAREEHIEEIVDMVEEYDVDGVDIDYESKLSETKDHFSAFLEELKDELGSKILACTVEARTPPSSRYRVVPADLEYANDYDEIGTHCDRVEIMAYDQQRADIKLNDAKSGAPYMPVADRDWVEKVIVETVKDIPEEKIILGVPTYGRHWTVEVAPNWFKDYASVGSVNMPDAIEIAEENDVSIGRNKAGEASFTYFPESSVFKVLKALPVPPGTAEGNEAAAQALLFANYTGMTVPVNLVWFSDAEAIEEKIDLAKEYALRGVALFKIDGEEDQDIWDLFR